MLRRNTLRVSVPLVACALLLGACSEDDGGQVRQIEGSESGTGSGSATGAGSGSATAAASGTATGTGVACEPVGDASEADSTVTVRLGEWYVTPEPARSAAGAIAFEAVNEGEEPHELVVVRAESAEDLPVREGKVSEDDLPEGAFVGEIEAFPSGETCTGVFDLDPGTYVLFCNIVETEEDGTIESHFEEGMHATFTVR